jgi:hypothetical protein
MNEEAMAHLEGTIVSTANKQTRREKKCFTSNVFEC